MQTSLNLVRPLTIYSGGMAEYDIDVKLFGVFSVKNVKVVVRDEVSVIAGGIPVGIYIKTEGILVGISSGAAVWAASKIAEKDEYKGKNIAVILPDSGDRYMSTGVFTDK